MTEPLVLLPGMMCDARLFGPQINALSRDHAVMVAPITRGDTIEAIAEGLLDQLPARFALAGLSMGGIVAMEILRRVPERVARLCLMDTDPLGETPQIAAMREPWIAQARAGRLDIAMEESLKPAFLAPGPDRMNLLRFMYEMAQELGAELFVRQSRALQRRVDQQDVLRKYHGPTLVLCGEHDGLTPVRRHEAMAALMPNARLVIVPGAGHLPTLEQPEAVTQELRAWLDRGDRAPR